MNDHAAPRHVRRPRWLARPLLLAVFGCLPVVGPVSAADEPAITVAPSLPTTPIVPDLPTTTTTRPTTTRPTKTRPTTTTTTPTTVPVTSTTSTTTTTSPASTTTTTTTTTTIAATTTTHAPHQTVVYPGPIADILATIRYLESRGRYDLPPNRGNASGAYQFIASTWQRYGGYSHAYLAPPHVQDERAAADVTTFLEQWGGDVSMIPVMWYYPRAARDPALMDVVPVPSAGNVLTIREYQQRWLGVLSTISGRPVPQLLAGGDAAAHLGAPPTPPQRDDDLPSLAFPVLGPSRLAVPDCDDATLLRGDGVNQVTRADLDEAGLCADQPPSIIFGVKLQPIMAATDGVVTDVRLDAPVSVTITDVEGRSYVYSGFNDDTPGTDDGAAPEHLRLTALADVGKTVWAGQIIGFMGDTDPLPVGVRTDVPTDATVVIDADATAPHLRLTIFDRDGTPIEAFGPVLDAQWMSTCRVGIGPWSAPPRDVAGKPTTIETTDNDRTIDSEWNITASGQVTATGWAAMINPHESCDWTPSIAFGADAAGSRDVPARWAGGLDLPTEIWLELALADDAAAGPLSRP